MTDKTSDNLAHLRQLDACLADVDDELKELMSMSLKERLDSLSTRPEKIQLVLNIAFAINSLYFVQLRTQGQNTQEHPVMEELDRIKLYFKKLKDAQAPRTMVVDKDASKRFVQAALGLPRKEVGLIGEKITKEGVSLIGEKIPKEGVSLIGEKSLKRPATPDISRPSSQTSDKSSKRKQ